MKMMPSVWMRWIIQLSLWDNDRLSALVANITNSDLLIMLSDIDDLLIKIQLFMIMQFWEKM